MMTNKLNMAATATLALSLAAAVPTAAAAAPLSTWYGRYAYSESLGRIGGSSPSEAPAAFVDHVLTIGRNGCTLVSQGFQTSQRIRCTVTPQGQSAIVKFYSYDGPARAARFSRGQTLLTLTRSGSRLLTRWQGMTRMDGSRPSQVAFRRQ